MPDDDADAPWRHRRAFQDRATRRALALYALRAFGFVLAGVLLLVVAGTLLLTPDGDSKPGIPDFISTGVIVAAFLLALFGGCGLLNVLRIVWVVARRPWRTVRAAFEEMPTGAPNGQPVVTLLDGEHRWTLTVSALMWKWGRFDRSELLLAARPGHGGVVATTDRGVIAWAGRSLYTAWLLRRRRGRHQA